MIRVFVDAIVPVSQNLVIEGPDARHLGGALRVKPGEVIVAVTPDGFEHEAKVVAATPQRVEVKVVASAPSTREPGLRAHVGVAVLKGDQLERIFEYCTEFGAASFQALMAERSVARIDPARAGERLRRWREIVRGAAALGQRGLVPAVLEPATPAEAVVAAVAGGMQAYLLYEGSRLESLSTVAFDAARPVAIIVGPEGGWSEAEVATMRTAGAVPVTLGPRIMRPLPAALAALSVVFHRAGELQLPKGDRG